MGKNFDSRKYWKSKLSKRLPRHKRPKLDKGTPYQPCYHRRAHRIHSGELYCPKCETVVMYEGEDRI